MLAALVLQWWQAQNMMPVLIDERWKQNSVRWGENAVGCLISCTCPHRSLYPPPVVALTPATLCWCFLQRSGKRHHSSLVWDHLTQHIYERFNPDKRLIKGEMGANNMKKGFHSPDIVRAYSSRQWLYFGRGFVSWLPASLRDCGQITEWQSQPQWFIQ